MSFQFLLSTRKHSPLEAEAVAREVGFDGIELVMLWEDTPARLQEYDRLTTVRAVHAPVTDFSRQEFSESLTRAGEMARYHNVQAIVMHPAPHHFGGRPDVLAGIKAIKAMKEVKICYEVLPRPAKEKHRLQQAYDGISAWLDDVRDHELFAALDTTHIASWGEDPAVWVSRLGKRLCHVHLSDYHKDTHEQHLFIGGGTIKFKRFFQELKCHYKPGPEFYLTLEPGNRFKLREHLGDLRESLDIMRRALA